MSEQRKFLAEIDRFLAETGMTQSELGLRVMNDTAFVTRLRLGKDVRSKSMDKVRAAMRAYTARRSKSHQKKAEASAS